MLKRYNIKDLIRLLIKNLKQKRLSKKLSHKYLKSFRISEIVKKQTYHLNLFTRFRIHLMFHVSLLKLNVRKEDNNETFKLFLLNLINDTKEYEMKEILNKKKYKDEVRYLIK